MTVSPLDDWIREKTEGFTLEQWQLHKLNQTLKLAQKSRFYQGRVPSGGLKALTELAELPLMGAEELIAEQKQLLCVHQGQIERVVSLVTSGSTAPPKRVYFTADDQELTVDFFARGMRTLVNPGEKMAVMMPCERIGGVGELICRGLARIPVMAIPYGVVKDFADAWRMLKESNAQTLVGIPVQVLALARYGALHKERPAIKRLLLSADNVPRILISELENLWDCEVFEHYGMTEMGLGGGIDCTAHAGYHLREADLYVEIIDPLTGAPLPAGELGEVVFTTLTRQGMPFIRYRTGDLSYIIDQPCPCGSSLRRLAPLAGRVKDQGLLTMPALDEVLLALSQVMDFMVEVDGVSGRCRLTVATFADEELLLPAVVQQIIQPLLPGGFNIEVKIVPCTNFTPLHSAKRLIKYIHG